MMHLINESPYDTRTLRRILVCTFRATCCWVKRRPTDFGWWRTIRVRVFTKRSSRLCADWVRMEELALQLSPLTGEEMAPLLRQRYNGSAATQERPSRALTSERVAFVGQRAWYERMGFYGDGSSMRRHIRDHLLKLGKRSVLEGLPTYVPLRVRREAPPRDAVRERYERVLALEKVWVRKAKLAQTKLKAYRTKRRRYEKAMAAREEAIACSAT